MADEAREEKDAGDDETTGGTSKTLYVRAAQKSRTWCTTTEEVAKFFESCGKPRAIVNKWGEESSDGKLREIAYVSFKKNKALQKALAMSGQKLSGRAVVIGVNTRTLERKKKPTSSVRIFVGNLPLSADDASVRELFSPCGKVLFIRFAVDAQGSPRGFCHVVFEDDDGSGKAAHSAIAMADVNMEGRALTIAAAVEKPKELKKPHAPKGPGHKRREPADSGTGAIGDSDAADDESLAEKKLRPSEWRHDRSAGLTMPRHHKHGIKGAKKGTDKDGGKDAVESGT